LDADPDPEKRDFAYLLQKGSRLDIISLKRRRARRMVVKVSWEGLNTFHGRRTDRQSTGSNFGSQLGREKGEKERGIRV